jgi:hypothetical protein
MTVLLNSIERSRSMTVLAALALAAVMTWGCASQSAPPEPRAARPANRYIYVTANNLPDQCYTDLGPVKVVEPFGDSTIDPDNSEARKRLRAAAVQAYPSDVDAVIKMQSDQNDAGTEVTVSGEAVRMEDSHTVQCTVRDAEGAMDNTAKTAAAAGTAADFGGLYNGSTGAIGMGIAGAAASGATMIIQHQIAKNNQQLAFQQTLGDQRREINKLLKERAQLQKCQESETPLNQCEASAQASSDQDASVTEAADRDAVNATPFQIEKQIQEQQDYIKQLQDQISQMKWAMSGH